MHAFLVVTIIACGVTVLFDFLLLVGVSNRSQAEAIGVVLINLMPLIAAIVALSCALEMTS